MDWRNINITVLLSFFYCRENWKVLNSGKNKWIIFIIAATILGAISGLYDKFIISRIDRIAVQAWFSFYQVVILLPVLAIFWYPNRKKHNIFSVALDNTCNWTGTGNRRFFYTSMP